MKVVLPKRKWTIEEFIAAVADRYERKDFVFFRIPQAILKEGTPQFKNRSEIATLISNQLKNSYMVLFKKDGDIVGVNPDPQAPVFDPALLDGPQGPYLAILAYKSKELFK